MDKQQAQQIIRDTFESRFNRDTYIRFLRNLLNSFDDESARINQGTRIPEKFQDHVEKIERIGKYTEDNIEIMLFIVYLKRETSIERARTMQRNFVAWYLSQGQKDAALVAYVSPDQADWRFSLVKMDYKFEKGETGKMKVKEEFTPARRWSFLVGENEKSHTAQSRLVKDLADDEHAPTLAKLEEAFNIETVTTEFFLKYRELFLCTKEALDKVVKNDPKIKADFEAKGVDTVNFAKKLLGQIVFLYFLQKKGWFGVGRDDDWGAGSKRFLRSLFAKQHGDYRNFFNDILEPLFYEALRIDRSHDDDYYSRFNCKIPFLNGGLFDPIGNYDWVHTDIHLPDDLFSNFRKTKEGDEGDGILDVFDRYNFTVREDEPLEKEVAIDPELLGKAYEKFNAIRPDNFDEFTKALKSGKKGEENKFNKKFGVYYTPREIVHYMCKQSLINYLFTRAEEDCLRATHRQAELSGAIKKQDIEDLIEVGEMITEHEATALIKQEKIKNGIQKSSEYTALLSDSIRENAAAIDNWLAEITVCDPAVGSGAFPVGMMNEIVRARNVLSVFLNDSERNDYEFKRRCIEHSLYGVDIDPGAVEIAKLRLWLSLVVDEEDIKNIKPLPNLDYKIVCGNSLLGVEKDLFNHQLFNDLEKLKPLHFNETNPAKKQEYKKQIDDLISQITKGHTEFDFEVYFSEVFHAKGGFDVVIANPPYISGWKDYEGSPAKVYFKENYETAVGHYDYYVLFYEKGFNLLKKNGVITYITSNKWMSQSYGIELRRLFIRNRIELIVDFNCIQVFEASVDTQISLSRKLDAEGDYIFKVVKYKEGENLFPLKQFENFNTRTIKQDEKLLFKLELNEEIIATLNSIRSKSFLLEDICYVSVGAICHSDKPKKIPKAHFIHSKQNHQESLKPYIEGKDITKWKITSSKFLDYQPKLFNQGAGFPELFTTTKLVNKRTCGRRGIEFTYDKEGYYTNEKVNNVLLARELRGLKYRQVKKQITEKKAKKSDEYSLKFILAILNSKLSNWYFKILMSNGLDFYPSNLREMPIPKMPSKNSQKPFIDLVENILAITKDADYLDNPAKQAQVKEYEKQIDRMVYDLYGLTEEEIRIVEGETK